MEVLLLGLIKLFLTIIILIWLFEIVIWAFIVFALITIAIRYVLFFLLRRGEKDELYKITSNRVC